MTTIREKTHEIAPYIIEIRRECHEYPEASLQEFETTKRIARELEAMGISCQLLEPTGLWGEIKGGKEGKTVALRADIDALSIDEKTDVPFKSKNDGFMHACGHDTHVACLLGALKVLNEMKEELNGTVRFIFQAAEEVAKGAELAIEQGVLNGVDGIYGQHIWGLEKKGTIVTRTGSFFASCDGFTLKIFGKACHGSAPEQGVDATVCAAAVVINLQSIASREVAATKPIVVSVGSLNSGTRFNIISGEAVLTGTCRSFDVELHHQIPEMMERIIKATCDAYRCTYEFEYNFMTEPLVNDPALTELSKKSAAKVVDSEDMVVEGEPIMGAEDFAAYTVSAPATFALLGGGGEYPQHSDYFWIDEDTLEVGAAMYAQFAVDFLNEM